MEFRATAFQNEENIFFRGEDLFYFAKSSRSDATSLFRTRLEGFAINYLTYTELKAAFSYAEWEQAKAITTAYRMR